MSCPRTLPIAATQPPARAARSPPRAARPVASPLVPDDKVPFAAYFIRMRTKTEMRSFAAQHALEWLRVQSKRGARGAVMLDIDDTLIDGHEKVAHGFECMKIMYDEATMLFPVHIVTARPDDDHANVMRMMHVRGFKVPPDRLHMLPAHLYGRDYSHVEEFKWRTFLAIAHAHGGVVARLGDKLWDVAHLGSLRTYLAHVDDRDCYAFMDSALGGTLSVKLPG